MLRRIVAALSLVVVCLPWLIAQEKEPPAEKKTKTSVRAVVKADAKLTKRIFLVLDVSGSMSQTDRVKRLLEVVVEVMNQPLDDFEVAIVAFSDRSYRWDGYVEPDDPSPPPKGWAKLPSANALKHAHEWVKHHVGEGGTEPAPALKVALSEPRKELSLLLATDGEYEPKPPLETLRERQEWRRKNAWGEAVVMVYGIGPDVAKQKHLEEFAKEGRGGLWVDQEAEEVMRRLENRRR